MNIGAITTASCKVNQKSLLYSVQTQLVLWENAKVLRGTANIFARERKSFVREPKYLCERTQKFCERTQISLRENAKVLWENPNIFARERKRFAKERNIFSRERKTLENIFFLPPWIFSTYPALFFHHYSRSRSRFLYLSHNKLYRV